MVLPLKFLPKVPDVIPQILQIFGVVERLEDEVSCGLGVSLAIPLFLPLGEVGVLPAGESGLDDFGCFAHVCLLLCLLKRVYVAVSSVLCMVRVCAGNLNFTGI